MLKKKSVILSLSEASISLLCAYLGFLQGAKYAVTSETIALVSISAEQIKMLESGNPEEGQRAVHLLNIQLNNEIDSYHWYKEVVIA